MKSIAQLDIGRGFFLLLLLDDSHGIPGAARRNWAQWLQEAHLTYPYHCCAFAFPAAHDPHEHARHQVSSRSNGAVTSACNKSELRACAEH